MTFMNRSLAAVSHTELEEGGEGAGGGVSGEMDGGVTGEVSVGE